MIFTRNNKNTVMFNKTTLAILAMLSAAGSAHAAQIFSYNFTGSNSWTMVGGGVMTTQTLGSAFTTNAGSLSPLITKVGADTDARSATLMAWFNLSDVVTATNLFSVLSNGTTIDGHGGYALSTNASSGLSVNQNQDSTGVLATIPSSGWVHVALTVEKSAVARTATAQLYVNGVLWNNGVAPSDLVFGTNLNGNGFTQLSVGAAGVSVGGLVVHDTALSSLDIGTAYATQTAIPEPSTYGLMGAGALAALAVVRRRKRA